MSRVPYLHLISQFTWHSRTSSWSLCLKVPEPSLHAGRIRKLSDNQEVNCKIRSQFHTKVILKDDQISVTGEGSPSIVGSFNGNYSDLCLINCFGCDLEDLPMILLQQVPLYYVYDKFSRIKHKTSILSCWWICMLIPMD